MSKQNRIALPTPREPQLIVPGKAVRYAPAVHVAPKQVNLGEVLLRRWKWFGICGVLGLAAGAYVMLNFSQATWTYTTTLLVRRPAPGELDYMPPSLSTLAALVKSPKTLADLQQEFGLEISREGLASSINAHTPYGSDALIIELTWRRPDEAETMLRRLTELFGAQLATLRDAALQRSLADADAGLKQSMSNLARAKVESMQFSRDERVLNVEKDLERIQQQVDELELQWESAKLAKRNCEAQMDKLFAAPVEPLVADNPQNPSAEQKDPRTGSSPPNDASAKRRVASLDLQRRTYLQERLRDEQERIATEAKLKMAEQEFERAKALYAKRYISQAEFERVQAELQTLQAMHGGRSVVQVRSQLEKINARMPNLMADQLAAGPLGPDLGAETVARLELELVACEGEIAHREQLLTAKKAEMQRVLNLRRQAQELSENVSVMLGERKMFEAKLAGARAAILADSDLFTIIEPPGPTLYPVVSNARRLFVLTFGAVSILLALPVLLREVISRRERPAEGAARRLGLPVLARSGLPGFSKHAAYPLEPGRDDDCPRMLALRIQQFLEKPGAVLLFSSLNHRPPSITLIARVAACFVQRGERVILVDLGKTVECRQGFAELVEPEALAQAQNKVRRPARAGMPRFLIRSKHKVEEQPLGVADFVAGDAAELDALILPSRFAGVACLLAGSVPLPVEATASRRMTELLDQLRKKYARVIVVGPTTSQPVDLEMLAARVDGLVFSTVGPRSENAAGEEVVSNLIDLDAPILGFVA